MNIRNIDFTGLAILASIATVAVAVFELYSNRKEIGDALAKLARDAGNLVNPTSDKNLAYRAANAVTQAATGNKDVSLGTWLAEKFNPDVRAADAELSRRLVTGDDWQSQLAAGWEEASGDAMRPVTVGEGGAAFGVYPSMR